MTTSTEQQLRDLLAADAAGAPSAAGLAEGARRRVRHRRRVQAGWAAAATAVAAVVLAGALTAGGPFRQTQGPPIAAPSGPVLQDPQPGDGALPDPATVSCAFAYSPAAVAKAPFAFDGTVTAIGPGRTNRPDMAALPLKSVTFHVDHWFTGGSGDTVVADMWPPQQPGRMMIDDTWPASYAVGTRLLVSGAPRWGGAPFDDAIAWGCGFTRYYDPRTAAEWASATK